MEADLSNKKNGSQRLKFVYFDIASIIDVNT